MKSKSVATNLTLKREFKKFALLFLNLFFIKAIVNEFILYL